MKNVIYIFFLTFIFGYQAKCQNLNGIVVYKFFHPQPNKNEPDGKHAQLTFINEKSIFEYSKNSFPKSYPIFTQSGSEIKYKETITDEIGDFIWRNFDSKEIVFRTLWGRFIKTIYVTDKWQDIQWEIKKGSKKIGKYECNKATANFRGRNYTAWFTTEIPVPYGPWKLFGLPGLILEASDDTKEFFVKATDINLGVEFACDEILPSKKMEDETMDFDSFKQYEKNFKAEYVKQFNSKIPLRLGINLNPENIKTNRMELDFEN